MQNQFDQFYGNNLSKFGPGAQGVGWKNEEAQRIRFLQLCRIINAPGKFSINDLGCGVGDLVTFLNDQGLSFTYHGYDVMQKMIDLASSRFDSTKDRTFSLIESAGEMKHADYTVASGIFNIRFSQDDPSWLEYILETLRTMNEKSDRGFAFNILTKYSDAEYMKSELYYADPGFLFDFCKRNFAKNVALLHDYDQYDFTILVRKKMN